MILKYPLLVISAPPLLSGCRKELSVLYCVYVIFIHNHPSGDPEPSEDDIGLTKRLVEAGEIMGIDVLDHIIIGDKKYLSLKREGLF